MFCVASPCSLLGMAKTAFYCSSTFCKNKYWRERQMERWRPQEAAYYQCSLQFWKARRQRSRHPVTSNTLNRLAELWDHPNYSPRHGLTAFPGSAQPVTSQWGGLLSISECYVYPCSTPSHLAPRYHSNLTQKCLSSQITCRRDRKKFCSFFPLF